MCPRRAPWSNGTLPRNDNALDTGRDIVLSLDAGAGCCSASRMPSFRHGSPCKAEISRGCRRKRSRNQPTLSYGQYVSGTVEQDARYPLRNGRSGRLRRDHEECGGYLPLSILNYPTPADLRQSGYVTLDVWLPEGQKASVPLLVVRATPRAWSTMRRPGCP